MNIVLSIGVLTGLFMVRYEKIIDDNGAVIGHIMPDSPAARAGIQPGDKIVRLNGKDNPDWEDIITAEIASVARPITVSYERQGHILLHFGHAGSRREIRPGRCRMVRPERNSGRAA